MMHTATDLVHFGVRDSVEIEALDLKLDPVPVGEQGREGRLNDALLGPDRRRQRQCEPPHSPPVFTLLAPAFARHQIAAALTWSPGSSHVEGSGRGNEGCD